MLVGFSVENLNATGLMVARLRSTNSACPRSQSPFHSNENPSTDRPCKRRLLVAPGEASPTTPDRSIGQRLGASKPATSIHRHRVLKSVLNTKGLR
jgi:hypothetical protein